MKFTVTKQAFLDGLQRVQNVISTRVTLPILSNILVETTPTGLRLVATDSELSISTLIPATVDKQGGTTLPARRLCSIIRELPCEEIFFETDSRNLTSIRSGPSFFKVYGLAKEEYPAFPSFEDLRGFTLQQTELKNGLDKTSYAVSEDEARYVLNGLLFSFKESRLTLVATDGRRLALCDVELGEIKYPAEHECDFIVPTKAIHELERLLTPDQDVRLYIGENRVVFELGNSILATKLVDGTYPNYRQVIPTECHERITLDREPLLQAARRAALLSTDRNSSICLKFTENNLDITSNAPEIGETKESLPISYKGRDLQMSFNPDFFLDPLKNLNEDSVILELIDEMSPGVFKINSTQRFVYVLMPIKVSL